VIYGDIGTSPLYVYSSTFESDPSYDDLLGVLSIIIWTLTLMVTVKYILIVLLADDEGEGGTFALYALLSRYVRHQNRPSSLCIPPANAFVGTQANITARDPASARLTEMKRAGKTLKRPNMAFRQFLEDSAVARALLKAVAVLGVCLMVAGMRRRRGLMTA
jgi:KUP system potassium uptake protein